MIWTDTHCHIHDSQFFPEGGHALYERARAAGVWRMITVGTDSESSKAAARFAASHDECFAAVGIHPHDAKAELAEFDEFVSWCKNANNQTLVAVGEIGLDYYYDHSPREQQKELLNRQIELAQQLNVPIIFHVREAFDDFWPIVDAFHGLRGVVHSFTDSIANMEQALSRGLYVGVNGIATFARERDDVTGAIPLDRLLLETDAPFLTPTPYRGKVNEPAFVTHVAQFVADLRSISLEELSNETEMNAQKLFF